MSHSREWVDYRSSLVPKSIEARSADWSQIPKELLEIQVSACISDAWEIEVSEIRLVGNVTAGVMKKVDPMEIAGLAYLTWLNDPQFAVSPQKLEIDFSSSDWSAKTAKLGKEMELEEVAAVYLLSPTRGTQNVMERLGYGSKTTAIRRVMEARKRGLIPPADAPKEDYSKALEAVRERRAG